MPWRQDSPGAFWLDPHPGLSGLPEDIQATLPGGIEGSFDALGHAGSPRFAVITVTDRTGFEYRRVVGLDDFVSQRDAAQLLDLPVMTLTRWTASRRLKSRKQNGFVVVRLGDLLDVVQRENRPLRTGRILATVHSAEEARSRVESEIITLASPDVRAVSGSVRRNPMIRTLHVTRRFPRPLAPTPG
jgi:hypothetical protein